MQNQRSISAFFKTATAEEKARQQQREFEQLDVSIAEAQAAATQRRLEAERNKSGGFYDTDMEAGLFL